MQKKKKSTPSFRSHTHFSMFACESERQLKTEPKKPNQLLCRYELSNQLQLSSDIWGDCMQLKSANRQMTWWWWCHHHIYVINASCRLHIHCVQIIRKSIRHSNIQTFRHSAVAFVLYKSAIDSQIDAKLNAYWINDANRFWLRFLISDGWFDFLGIS